MTPDKSGSEEYRLNMPRYTPITISQGDHVDGVGAPVLILEMRWQIRLSTINDSGIPDLFRNVVRT